MTPEEACAIDDALRASDRIDIGELIEAVHALRQALADEEAVTTMWHGQWHEMQAERDDALAKLAEATKVLDMVRETYPPSGHDLKDYLELRARLRIALAALDRAGG